MLNITIKTVENQLFTSTMDPGSSQWTCIGYGQDPKSGVNYVVGTTFDSVNNRSRMATFLIKDVTFIGPISPPTS
jgi:hypothetical protein